MKLNLKLMLIFTIFCMNALGCGSDTETTKRGSDERISSAQIDADNDGEIDIIVIYSYNDLGQLVQEKYEAGYYASTESYLKYIYDSSGYLKEEILEDSGGTIIRHLIYNYDDSCFKNKVDLVIGSSYGTITESFYCDEDGNIRLSQIDSNEDHIIDEEVVTENH